MIVTLEEAKQANEKITKLQLDALESFIRAETNNSFHNKNIRFRNVEIEAPNIIRFNKIPIGLSKGNTIEVNYSSYNDDLYVIDEVAGNEVKIIRDDTEPLIDESNSKVMVTKVVYPLEVKQGILSILEYDLKMVDKLGLKSKTVARMSETYQDLTKSEVIGNRPAYLFSFLNNYYKYGG